MEIAKVTQVNVLAIQQPVPDFIGECHQHSIDIDMTDGGRCVRYTLGNGFQVDRLAPGNGGIELFWFAWLGWISSFNCFIMNWHIYSYLFGKIAFMFCKIAFIFSKTAFMF